VRQKVCQSYPSQQGVVKPSPTTVNNVLESGAFDRRLLFQSRRLVASRGPASRCVKQQPGTREKPSLYFTLGRRRFMSLFTTGRHRVKTSGQRLFRPAALPLWADPSRPDCAAESFSSGGQRQAAGYCRWPSSMSSYPSVIYLFGRRVRVLAERLVFRSKWLNIKPLRRSLVKCKSRSRNEVPPFDWSVKCCHGCGHS
jgi:hypothetical protein